MAKPGPTISTGQSELLPWPPPAPRPSPLFSASSSSPPLLPPTPQVHLQQRHAQDERGPVQALTVQNGTPLQAQSVLNGTVHRAQPSPIPGPAGTVIINGRTYSAPNRVAGHTFNSHVIQGQANPSPVLGSAQSTLQSSFAPRTIAGRQAQPVKAQLQQPSQGHKAFDTAPKPAQAYQPQTFINGQPTILNNRKHVAQTYIPPQSKITHRFSSQPYSAQQANSAPRSKGHPRTTFEDGYPTNTTMPSFCKDPCSPTACEHARRSTLYRACCEKDRKAPRAGASLQVYPILVTGTPRSATNGVLDLLTSLGLDLGNDWGPIRPDGRSSWIHLYSETDHVEHKQNTIPLPYLGSEFHRYIENQRYANILHLVRDPLASITSIACTEPLRSIQWAQFVKTHIKTRGWSSYYPPVSDFVMAMVLWREWHSFIDATCAPRVQIEKLFSPAHAHEQVGKIFGVLHRAAPSRETVRQKLATLPTDAKNARPHRPKASWLELFQADADLATEILTMARTYGYDYTDVDPVKMRAEAEQASAAAKSGPRHYHVSSQIRGPTCNWGGETKRGTVDEWSVLPQNLVPRKNWRRRLLAAVETRRARAPSREGHDHWQRHRHRAA